MVLTHIPCPVQSFIGTSQILPVLIWFFEHFDPSSVRPDTASLAALDGEAKKSQKFYSLYNRYNSNQGQRASTLPKGRLD